MTKKLEIYISVCLSLILLLFIITAINTDKICTSIDKSISTNKSKDVMNFAEAAEYMKLTPEALTILLERDSGLCYTKIKTEYIFTSDNIDIWLKDRRFIIK